MGSPDLYFFHQCDSTRKVPRRYRKLPEELPESLRFAHLNPKVAALLASKEHSKHKLDNEDPFGDGLGKKSLLPDINSAFQNVRNQFDSALSNDEDSQRYLFEEAKLSSQTVLDQLSRIIYYYEDLHKHIPKSLEYQLLNNFVELTSDVTVVPREWQTHEMKEQHAAKMQQEPNSDEEYSDTEALTGRTKSRFGVSERSGSDVKTIKKPRSKLGTLDGNEDIEINIMKAESRAGRRTDSRLSATGSQLRQPIDLGNLSRVGSRRKGSRMSVMGGQTSRMSRMSRMRLRIGSHRSISAMSPATQVKGRDNFLSSFVNETPSDARYVVENRLTKVFQNLTKKKIRATALANPLSYMQTINFQLSNKQFEEKGWVMLKGREEEVDQSAILDYCIKVLQESMKQIELERKKELDQGFDKPVIVRYYGDTKKETLLKYRKSPVKSNPSPLLKGCKPRIPSINDEKNEGKKLMQASHIDGTTLVYYPSGRPAVVHSSAGFGRPGFYTIAYEDGLDSRMLACFTPSGRGVCYYDNGIVRFLATEKGGHLTELDGALIRKWKWPQSNVKITEPISFQINNHLTLRCVSQGQIGLVFSCQRETARFSVSPVPDAEEYKGTDESDHLLTAFTFSSKAAKDLMRLFNPNKKSKKKYRKHSATSEEEADENTEDKKEAADMMKQVTFAQRLFDPTLRSKSPFSMLPELQSTVNKSRYRKSVGQFAVAQLLAKELTQSSSKHKDVDEAEPEEGKTWSDRRKSMTPELKHSDAMERHVDEAAKRSQSAKSRGNQQCKDVKVGKNKKQRPMTTSSSKATPGTSSEVVKTGDDINRPAKVKRDVAEKIETDSKGRSSAKQYENPEKATDEPIELAVVMSVADVLDAFQNKPVLKPSSSSGISLKSPMSQSKFAGKSKSAKHKPTSVSASDLQKHSRSSVELVANDNQVDPSKMKQKSEVDLQFAKALEKSEDDPRKASDLKVSFDVQKMLTSAESSRNMANSVKILVTRTSGSSINVTNINAEEMNKACLNPSIDNLTDSKLGSASDVDDDEEVPTIVLTDPQSMSSVITFNVDEADLTKELSETIETGVKVSTSGKSLSASRRSSMSLIDKIEAEDTVRTDDVEGFGEDSEDSLPEINATEQCQINRAQQRTRRKSTLMKSIFEYRKKVLAKKGIVLEDSSEDETDDDEEEEDKSKSQTTEIIKLLADFPDKVTYELEADKELARLQRKARNLVDDWMEHYRIAVGLTPTSLQALKDTPNYDIHKRNIKSARHSEQQQLIRKAVMGVDDYDEMTSARKARITSAPLGGLGKQFSIDDEHLGSPERPAGTVTFDQQKPAAGDGTVSPTAVAVMTRLAETADRRSARSARSTRASNSARSSPCRLSLQQQQEVQPPAPPTRSHCPVVVRQQHLGYERIQCRCSRHQIPFIMDIELDDFVATETPEGQLTVIMVVSSLFPGVTQAEEMLNEIYGNQNRNRTRPCVQSRSDMFRVFKYDINSAAEMSDHTQPLLLTRHNVVPGMILIYCDGKLLFCDHIFNGYGNTRKDFKKQIMKSRYDSIQGVSLPKDFRFSPGRGKSGWRSAWGGEIGGAGIDKYSSTGTVLDTSLHPIHRPSSSTSSDNSKEVHMDTVKRLRARVLKMRLQTAPSLRPPQQMVLEEYRSLSTTPRIGASGPSHESVEHRSHGIHPEHTVLSHSSSYATSLNSTALNSFASTGLNTASISGTT